MKKVLKFYSEGCGPCKLMGQRLEDIAKTVEFELINIDIMEDDNESLIDEWKPRTVPTIIIIDEDQKVLGEFKGVTPIETLQNILDNGK